MERYIYEKILNDYGKVVLTLDELLKRKNINSYKLSTMTGINWSIINKYRNMSIYRIDLDILAKICYSLGCGLEEIIHYEPSNTLEFEVDKSK